MADWNVHVENQVCVELDAEAHATLLEIRDLLRLVVERLPAPNAVSVHVEPLKCSRCGGHWISIPRMGIHHVCPDGERGATPSAETQESNDA